MAIPKIPAESPSFATGSSKLVANCKVKLTENRIDKLQSPATGRAYVYDTATRGLAVGISPQGKKVFVHYRKVGTQPRRVTLGDCREMTLDQARTNAEERNAAIGRGEDPDANVIRATDTLETLFTRYGEDIGATKKTWKNDQSMYRNHLAAWKDKRLSAITRDDVKALHAKIGRKHPTQANRVCELLCSLFAFAAWPIDQNPARGKSKHFPDGIPAYRETKRERFLSG
ncbi:MAG: Arm DNA-binding domain-containing protein, partial [Candidatus Sulfotelmatobacter sp.]